jgi:biopolymer transport protein ExbB
MNYRILSTMLAVALASPTLFAQDPVATARKDLNKAVTELNSSQKEYADLRRSLYRDINKLDDEALALGKELKALKREEELRTATLMTLTREIEARKTDFDYSAGILNQYSKALVTRLHPAENQLFKDLLEAGDQRAASLAGDPKEELMERVKILELGLDRVGKSAGGMIFQGKALRNGSESIEGTLLVAGPSVFFSSKDGNFEGVATFAESGTALPTVLGIEGSKGLITETLKTGSGNLPFDGTMGKAIEVAAAKESLMDTIKKGGIVGHAILVLGAISFLIALFKVWEISRIHLPSRTVLNRILDDLLVGEREAAARKAAEIPGDAGKLVQVAVSMFYEKRRVLEEAIFERLVTIKPKMDRFLPFLALTAAAAPLMGLLGTVLGIIKTFQAMALYGTGNAKSFSAGISEALITTAEGLIVAIPVLIIHGMLKSYVKGRFSEFEGIGIALINGTTERERKSESKDQDESQDDDFELTPNPA